MNREGVQQSSYVCPNNIWMSVEDCFLLFTALHICNAVFPIAKVSVCPSVCLSITRVNCDKTNESPAEILIPYEKKIHVVVGTHRMVGGRRPLLTEILGQTGPPSFKNGDFQSIFACSASVVTPSEKSSVITNRKSTTHVQMSLRWTAYVAFKPLKGAQKRRMGVIPIKVDFSRRKSATKFLRGKTFSGKVVKAFTGLSNRAQIVDGDVSFYVKFWAKLTHPYKNVDLYFAHAASAVTPGEKSSISPKGKGSPRRDF